MIEPVIAETASTIADRLGENEEEPRQKIVRIVKVIGPNQAYELLNEALQVEEHGGLMTKNGARRRTLGGVWFFLAKEMRRRLRKEKSPESPSVKQSQQKAALSQQDPQPAIIFAWNDRIAAVKEAETEKGNVSVKITVIGRPGRIVERGSCIITVMESTKVPMLPKGLPTPTSAPTKYAVYIASKQWKKVEEAMKDTEDTLIVEGFPKTDPEVSAIAVFATNVTTKKLQTAKKRPQ